MRNIKMVIAYDGTQYHGFQVQNKTGLRTIQDELEKAIQKLTGEHVNVYGSGRTDAGVHAWGQVVNFVSNTRIPEEKIPYAMNSCLPRDIVVRDAKDVSADFHARFFAKKKTYCYSIYNARHFSPFYRYYSVHVPAKLDLEQMVRGAQYFIGEHDFTAYCAKNTAVTDHVRTIYNFKIEKEQEQFRFIVTGNGFLYNMVRIMTGTLLEVGENKRTPEEISVILKSKERKEAGMTLPPQGLCLWSVQY